MLAAGEAVSFFTEKDLPQLRRIANIIRQSGCEVPDWMLHLGSKHERGNKRRRTTRKEAS